jgi:oligoendopeptidase F
MTLTYTPTRWSLSDLFPAADSPEMQAAFNQLEAEVTAFESRRDQLAATISIADFMAIAQQYEDLNRLGNRIHGFAELGFNADTQDQVAQSFLMKVEQTMASVQNRTLFFSLWWKDLDDENAARLMAESGDYRYWLEEMRHFKPHTLSEPEEKIVNIKNVTGASALRNLYDSITNRYIFKLEVDGEVKELTRDALMVYVQGPDPELRAAAYQEMYRVYSADGPILGQMYQTMATDWKNEQLELRHFETPIAARNLDNDIPDQVVSTLLEVCERNAALFQRYFRLKARWLGIDRLRRYDIYAPVAQADKRYDFDLATKMVLDSFRDFTPEISELVEKVYAVDHVDSEVRKGKQSGAFCASIGPDLAPWVLLNYQGRARDVATLAHEMGHAIHSMLASQHSLFTFHASLPLAETASTFGEMLLIDRMLAVEGDEDVRRDILFRQVDDAYATIIRQSFFAMFERQAHQMVSQGTTVDELSEAYLQNLKAQFGDALELSDEFRWEWVAIPHFYHVPFYVYAYTFGQLLVLSLYQQYREEGEAFKPRYLKILSAGGSEAPVRVLSEAGIDIYSADFWQGGFNAIAKQLDQLEAIPVKKI